MLKRKRFFLACLLLMTSSLVAMSQSLQFYGVKNTMRYDDGDDTKYEYLGWNAELGVAEFLGDVGMWSLDVNGNTIASNLVNYDNLMYGNSGSVCVNSIIYTVMSHEDPDADEEGKMEFVVRKWNAETYEMISSERFPKSSNLESRGMAYNPVDGKVYGLFYLTDVALPVPDEELDPEDVQEGYTSDAGYALCTIDLTTMEIQQVTPGIYYDNFVTLACSAEGKMYSITSGGTLCEFDSASGLIVSEKSTGVKSQFKRQAACFDYNTGKLYWNGYVNSGMGINDWGSWGPLSDRDWRTNGKYDTALYEVNVETGAATKIADIPNRIAFSSLWVAGSDFTQGVENVEANESGSVSVYNTNGQLVYSGAESNAELGNGVFIVKNGHNTKKIINK